MIGTPLLAAWVALAGFWILLVWGLVSEELTWRGAGIAVALWLLGRVLIGWSGLALFPSYVAILDIALVFAIFKGDIRLT
jgi:hypothetical protein